MRATLPLCPECRCLLVLSKELPSRTYSQSATARFTLGESATVMTRLSTPWDGVTDASRVIHSAILTDGQGVTVPCARQLTSCPHTTSMPMGTSSSSLYPASPAGCVSSHGDIPQAQSRDPMDLSKGKQSDASAHRRMSGRACRLWHEDRAILSLNPPGDRGSHASLA
jgi:hypothetical protein